MVTGAVPTAGAPDGAVQSTARIHVDRPISGLGKRSRVEVVGQAPESAATLTSTGRDLVPLVARLAEGDESALATLYDATSSLVYGLALRILRDEPAAEEVTIEVYMQALRQAGTYDPVRGTPWAWLITLARSRALDRVRIESRRRERHEPLEAVLEATSPDAGPDESAALAERGRLVRAALATLSPEQREVIEVAYYAGLSHTEIALHLGLPVGTVKTRIRTAMLRLRSELTPLLTGEPA